MLKPILYFSLILIASPMPGAAQGTPEDHLNLKLIVVDRAGLYPCAVDSPAEQERERVRAAAEFAQIRKDTDVFTLAASHLGFRTDARFTLDEQVLLHCYYRKLREVQLKPEGDRFRVITATDENLYIDDRGRLTDMHTSVAEPSVSRPLREMSAPPVVPAGPSVKPKLTAVAQRHYLVVHYRHLNSCRPMNPVAPGYGYEEMERADSEAFAEIRRLRGLTATLSTRAKHEMLAEYESMQSIRMERLVDGYYFELIPARSGNNTVAMKVEGIVSVHGRVRELRRQAVAAVCPK